MNALPPDLSSRESRRVYRREMRGVAARSRRIGLLFLIAALMVGLLPIMDVHDLAGWSPRFLALLLIIPAGILLGIAIVSGAQHHRRRMRG